jgi:hypothetical protein
VRFAGDDAHARPAVDVDGRHVGGRDVAVARSRHLVLRGQVHPQLEPGHATFLLLRHLGVHDAAPRRHPLHAARLQQADVADAVVVAHAAGEHDRHRLEAAVRMVREAAHVVARRVAAERVEHEERVEAALQGLGQHAGQAHARAVGRGLAAHQALDGARLADGAGGNGHGAVLAKARRCG